MQRYSSDFFLPLDEYEIFKNIKQKNELKLSQKLFLLKTNPALSSSGLLFSINKLNIRNK